MAARKPASAAAAPAPEEKAKETTEDTAADNSTTEDTSAPEQATEQPKDEAPAAEEPQGAPDGGANPDGGTPADEEPQDDETEDEDDSFLASLSLATEVHVQIDDRYQPFPAGTRIGDVVNGVEFSEELAGTVTNRKAWVIPTQDD